LALVGDGRREVLEACFNARVDGMSVVKDVALDFFAAAARHAPDPSSEPSKTSLLQLPAFRLWGFIGAPGVSRATREDQHLFVNRRPVENRGLNYALLEGYHTSLMKGRYPVCSLFLEID